MTLKHKKRTSHTVADINPSLIRTLDYGNYGTFLIMGHAGFVSSTVIQRIACGDGDGEIDSYSPQH